MINPSPLISVILPVYNGSLYLDDAIKSVLNQSYENFELIIINDGSTDNSASIIRSFKDKRIKYYQQSNQGLARSLNNGIEHTSGVYIARHDQDDLAKPHRFQKQIDFLESHIDYGMVGTWAEIWVDNQSTSRTHRHPANNLIIKFFLNFNNPFVHSSMMIRKSVLEDIGVYSTDPARQPPEDYELWSRIARKYKVSNIQEILQVYREIPNSMSRSGENPFKEKIELISNENISWYLNNEHSAQHNELINFINRSYEDIGNYLDLNRVYSTINKLSESIIVNNVSNFKEIKEFRTYITCLYKRKRRTYRIKKLPYLKYLASLPILSRFI